MARKLNLKISVNKITGQIVASLPKKKISAKKLKEILEMKRVKIEIK